MFKKPYLNKRNIICSSIIIFLIILVVTIAMLMNPIRRAKYLLESKSYKGIVSIYNDNNLNSKEKSEIEAMINDSIDNALDLWNEEDISFNNVKNIFSVFVNVKNEDISKKATENLRFVKVEHQGNILLKKAEEAYEKKDYLLAMKEIMQIDQSYTQYANMEKLYEICKSSLLSEINVPNTISEYEQAIKTLDAYYTEVQDADILRKKNELENTLGEYKKIYDILVEATNLYEKEKYKDSFVLLDEAKKKYPENNKIKYVQSSYQYAYVLKITDEVVTLTEKEDYKGATELLEKSIEIYDCEIFQEELKAAKMKSDKFFFVKAKLADAGDYIYRSTKKMVLGDFSEDEQDTLLSLGGSVAASLVNADAPMDVRDLAYDISHWGEGDYFAARLALDAIGIIPVIGAIKYIKHADTVADVAKQTDKVADVVDTTKDVAKISKDSIKNLINGTDVVADVKKKTENVSDLTDDFSDFKKKTNKADQISDAVDEGQIYYKQIDRNINKAYENKFYPGTEIKFVRRNLDLSDGRHLTGVFPVFKSKCDLMLPKEYWKESSNKQLRYLSEEIKKMMNTPKGKRALKKQFNDEELADLAQGIIPEGYVWHHHETEGFMQLVDAGDHAKVRHTGGMSIWGQGY